MTTVEAAAPEIVGDITEEEVIEDDRTAWERMTQGPFDPHARFSNEMFDILDDLFEEALQESLNDPDDDLEEEGSNYDHFRYEEIIESALREVWKNFNVTLHVLHDRWAQLKNNVDYSLKPIGHWGEEIVMRMMSYAYTGMDHTYKSAVKPNAWTSIKDFEYCCSVAKDLPAGAVRERALRFIEVMSSNYWGTAQSGAKL